MQSSSARMIRPSRCSGAERRWILFFIQASCLFHAALLCAEEPPSRPRERIVFVGDSITDGHTYPLMVRASIEAAGRAAPICINAGVAGDTAQGMLARLDRDVLVHRPTLVTLSAGINDVLRGVSTENYARDMRAIAQRLSEEKIPLVILTPTILGPKHSAAQEKLSEYIEAIRGIAHEHNCRIAETHQALRTAAARGEAVLSADEVHLTLTGYRRFTRALLDALGHESFPVVEELKYEPMPGVIKNWDVRVATEEERNLDESQARAAWGRGEWKSLVLPLSEPEPEWWMDQERQRGFAVSLGKRIGPGKKFLAKAEVIAESTYSGYLNIGADVEKVWLNGNLVYQNEGWTGWHAGKERIFVTFDQGKNIIGVASGDTYFLSITIKNDW